MPMKKTTIAINTECIQCHPHAIDAWLFSQQKVHQYSVENIGTELVSLMQNLDPIHGVKNDDGSVRFFAGWRWLALAQRNNIKKISAIIYNNPSNDLINRFSWAYLLSSELSSSHRKNNLAYMSDLLKKIPKDLTSSIYQSYEAKSFELLSGETPSAVKHQRKLHDGSEGNLSIIDQILADD